MKWILIITAIFFLSCQGNRSMDFINIQEKEILADFQSLNPESMLKIADEKEPGEKLLLCLKFVNKKSKEPLQKRSVKFYHTSTLGEYEPAVLNDESTARLSGQATTAADGSILVETILPGNYGSGGNNRHIHTTVFGAQPEGYDIHFKQHSSFMSKNFIEGSDQHFLADLKLNSVNKLIAFLTIEVKEPE